MPLARITSVGGDLYHVHVMDSVDPGFGGGRPGGVDPGWGQGHPGHRPDQGLPGGGHISNRPPGSGNPAFPDNTLPDHPPPTLAPGYTIVMVRGPHGKWEYAFIAPSDPPPKPLPNPPEHVGGRPPGMGPPNVPGQGLPGGPPAHGPGQPGGIPHPGGGPMPPMGSTQPLPPGVTPPNYPTGQPLPPQPAPQGR